jgi:hypothetical protein
MRDRFKFVADNNNVQFLLDGEVLIQQHKFGYWIYIHEINGEIIHESLKKFDDKFIQVFIDDIISQLENGIDRNNLVMNIPEEIRTVKIGDKIINI